MNVCIRAEVYNLGRTKRPRKLLLRPEDVLHLLSMRTSQPDIVTTRDLNIIFFFLLPSFCWGSRSLRDYRTDLLVEPIYAGSAQLLCRL